MVNRRLGSNIRLNWLLFLAICPALITAALMVSNWVNVPVGDEWDLFTLYKQFGEGSLHFTSLFHQVYEYRQFFPNVIFVAVEWITKGDLRYLMALSFLFACLVSFNIYHLGKLTLPQHRSIRLSTFFLSNLIIFSPVQHENWIQGQQLIYFIPIACLTAGLLICFSNLRLGAKFLICGALATVATFSSANGMVCWIVLLPALFLAANKNESRKQKIFSLLWLIAFILNGAAYLIQYQQPQALPSPINVLFHPLSATAFFLALFGRPLALGPVWIATAIGLILLLAFVVLAWQALRTLKKDATNKLQTICWLIVGCYSILSAILVTVGRVGLGLEYVQAPRYTTFTLYLMVALIYLVTIRFYPTAEAIRRDHVAKVRRLRALAAVFVVLNVGQYLVGVTRLSNLKILLLELQACVVFSRVVSEPCNSSLLQWPPNLQQQFYLANSLGMLNPGMIEPGSFAQTQITSGTAGEFGTFEKLERIASDTYVAYGSAFLKERDEPADAIMLAYERVGEPPVFLSPSATKFNRDWFSVLRGAGIYKDPRWKRTFIVKPDDQRQTTVSAWAVDVSSGKVYKLAGTHVLK